MRAPAFALVILALVLPACGGAETPTHARADTVDPPHYLLEVGAARVPALARPAGDPDTLGQAVRDAPPGNERRTAMREAAIGLMYAAESENDPRTKRRLRRASSRYADRAASGSRDEFQNALMEFVKIFNAWRAAARNASRLAERFTTRRRDSGELYSLMWAIRGEIALELERYGEAAEAFRYYLGQLDHPLYAYGLWRTARSYQGMDRDPDAIQALQEARDLGCPESVDPAVLKIATIAGREAGTNAVRWPDGSIRPSSCPMPSAEEP